MSYEGVKYHSIIHDASLPSDKRVNELRAWCKTFHEKNLAPHYPGGTHGNMSFRLKRDEETFIITAARTSFAEDLADDSFFLIQKVDRKEMKVFAMGNPKREPSSETLLHNAIYQARPDVQAILHGHCKTISKHSEIMGIPTTSEFVESGTHKIVESVLEILNDDNFIEIKDHGFMALGKSIEDAGRLSMEMLERSITNLPG